MMVHIYRHGDADGLHIDTSRVTVRDGVPCGLGINERMLICGTLPHINAIPFDQIEWFWIEES